MLGKFQLIAYQYSVLLFFAFSFFGWGRIFTDRICKEFPIPGLYIPVSTALGMGISCVVMQVLGIAGFIQLPYIYAYLCTGLIFAIAPLIRNRQVYLEKFRAAITAEGSLSQKIKGCFSPPVVIIFLVVLFVISKTIVQPLIPPHQWDELMYHLPHAREWAQSGRLTVNEWLRYPWFPYNINLIYSAGYLVAGDLFTHMLHALSGWLVCAMLFIFTLRYSSHWTAAFAAVIWIIVSKDYFSNAYIDMGVTLFTFSSCIAFLLFLQEAKNLKWLFLSGFLIGIAIGSKYQAVGHIPIVILGLLIYSRNPKSFAALAISMLLPAFYWYARNYWMTGNPINPLAGSVFGYFDWNQGDIDYQFFDLKRAKSWPFWGLWFAALALLIPKFWKNFVLRAAIIYSIYSFGFWYFTSAYERYLMPSVPVIAFLSVMSIRHLALAGLQLLRSVGRFKFYENSVKNKPVSGFIFISVASIVFIFGITTVSKNFKDLPVDTVSKGNFLRMHVEGFDLLQRIRSKSPGRVYHLGLEGSIYYGPTPSWGDHFGPWRYREYAFLGTEGLAKRLKSEGFTHLLVHRYSNLHLESDPIHSRYYKKLDEQDGSKFFELIQDGIETNP